MHQLKTKWLWRFSKEDNAMRKNVTNTKYGINDLDLGLRRVLMLTKLVIGIFFFVFEHFKFLVHFEVTRFYFGMMSGVGINL